MDDQEHAPHHEPAPTDKQREDRPPRRDQRQRRPDRPGPDSPNSGSGQQGGHPPRKAGSGGGQSDGRDGRKRRRDGDRRPAMAFGDNIERAVCTAYRRWEPDAFPIQHRTGLATRRIVEIARRPEATLFCDAAHAGPCIWPDGELVFLDEPEPPVIEPVPVAAETSDIDETPPVEAASEFFEEPPADLEAAFADADEPASPDPEEESEQVDLESDSSEH